LKFEYIPDEGLASPDVYDPPLATPAAYPEALYMEDGNDPVGGEPNGLFDAYWEEPFDVKDGYI